MSEDTHEHNPTETPETRATETLSAIIDPDNKRLALQLRRGGARAFGRMSRAVQVLPFLIKSSEATAIQLDMLERVLTGKVDDGGLEMLAILFGCPPTEKDVAGHVLDRLKTAVMAGDAASHYAENGCKHARELLTSVVAAAMEDEGSDIEVQDLWDMWGGDNPDGIQEGEPFPEEEQ